MVGLVMQRALILCFCAALPIVALMHHSLPLLTLVGLPLEVAQGTARYLFLFSPALLINSVSCVLVKYLMSQVCCRVAGVGSG